MSLWVFDVFVVFGLIVRVVYRLITKDRSVYCVICSMKLKRVYRNPIDGQPRCGYDVDYFYQKRVGLTRQQYIQQYGSKDLILEGE